MPVNVKPVAVLRVSEPDFEIHYVSITNYLVLKRFRSSGMR